MNLVRDSNNIIASNTETIAKNNEEIKNLRSENERLREDLSYFRDKLNVFMNSTIESNSRLHERMDVLTNLTTINTVKKPNKPVKPVVETRVRCKCLTKKGDQCKKYCIPDHDTCKQHANMANVKPYTVDDKEKEDGNGTTDTTTDETSSTKPKPKPVIIKKRKTSKKEKVKPPMHNHDPGETPSEPCELCITHGDTLDMSMPEYKYECLPVNGLSLEERLQIAIDNENKELDDPGDPVETLDPEPDPESEPVPVNENWADMVDDEQ
jgi:hypothetical protein